MIAKKVPNPKKSAGKAERAGGLADYIKVLHLGERNGHDFGRGGAQLPRRAFRDDRVEREA